MTPETLPMLEYATPARSKQRVNVEFVVSMVLSALLLGGLFFWARFFVAFGFR